MTRGMLMITRRREFQMKRVEITLGELYGKDPEIFIPTKLKDAGFDMSKDVKLVIDSVNMQYFYTQE